METITLKFEGIEADLIISLGRVILTNDLQDQEEKLFASILHDVLIKINPSFSIENPDTALNQTRKQNRNLKVSFKFHEAYLLNHILNDLDNTFPQSMIDARDNIVKKLAL